MNPEMERRRELARARTVAARERVRTIRRRVAVGTASVFAAAWFGVFGQLVSGEDPALGSGIKTSKTTAAAGSIAGESRRQSRSSAEPTVRTTSPVAPAQPTVAATPLTTRQS
jgi:hypothetical protein